MTEPPPPIIASARLLEYAIIDRSMVFTGRNSLYVDGELLGPVPRLAVCQDVDDSAFILYHCGEEWEVLAVVTGEKSLNDMKGFAERNYLGLAGNWILSPYTEEEINLYWQIELSVPACSFCLKSVYHVQQVIENTETNAAICDACIDSFYKDIHSSSS